MSLKKTQIQAIIFLLSSIVASVSSINDDYNYNVEKKELVQLFEQWMQQHEKYYAQLEDKARGFKNFVKNAVYVNKWNANKEKGTHVLGLNNFADLNVEELSKKYLSKIHTRKRRSREQIKDNMNMKRENGSRNAPPFLDWRMHGVISEVKNQECGDCWAFASTGAIEAINAIKRGKLITLSEQELTDCVATNGGCDGGGFMENAFEWVVKNGGINSESNYPYIGKDHTCNISKGENKIVKIDGYKYVASKNEALLWALLKQPIGVSIAVNTPDFFYYAGGIYDGNCSNHPSDIDHQVLLVGYGSENGSDYWIIKNSWSIDWGMKGYMYIKRDNTIPYGKCAILSEAVYPTINNGSSHLHYVPNNHAFYSHKSGFWGIFTMVFFSFLNIFVY